MGLSGVCGAAAADPDWWFGWAEQAASERAPHSAVASERLAVDVRANQGCAVPSQA